ncbi:MAG: FHA domain-containing protein [bacterium]
MLDDAEFTAEVTRVFDREAPAVGPALPRGRLVAVAGEEVGKTWYLNRPLTHLGRGNDNDVVILDISASRKHLRLDRHAEGFRVVDLQSGNGTQVNGRRVTRQELYDGDRIEIGSHVLEFTTLGTPRERPRDPQRATDPNVRVRPMTPPATPGVPRTWLIIWSLATFLAVFGTMYLTRHFKRQRAAEDAAQMAAGYVEVAREAAGRRDWAQARASLEAARATGAPPEELASLLAEVDAEERALHALREAGVHLDARESAQARTALLRVPPSSLYAAEARLLTDRVRALERDQQMAQAEKARDAGHEAEARDLAARVLADDPQDARARALLEAIAAAAPASGAAPGAMRLRRPLPPRRRLRLRRRLRPRRRRRPRRPLWPRRPLPRRRPRPSSPTAAGGDAEAREAMSRAMNQYRGRKFADARTWLDRAAREARSEDLRRQARSRSRALDTLTAALSQAEAAEKANKRGDAIGALERALGADRVLGGALRGRIQQDLARHLVYEALRDFVSRRYGEAARQTRRALSYDPGLSQARDLARKIEAQAGPLMQRARAASGDERRRLAEQVRQMVEPGSALAREAEALLKE